MAWLPTSVCLLSFVFAFMANQHWDTCMLVRCYEVAQENSLGIAVATCRRLYHIPRLQMLAYRLFDSLHTSIIVLCEVAFPRNSKLNLAHTTKYSTTTNCNYLQEVPCKCLPVEQLPINVFFVSGQLGT